MRTANKSGTPSLRVVIFVNGRFPNPADTRQHLQPDDYIIAVNGGTRHALRAGVVPHVIIGDLDSLPPEAREQIAASGAQVLQFPPRKDETDLELALQHALDQHSTTIVLFAALGGRLDHLLANVFLLALPALREHDIRIIEGAQTAFLIRQTARIHGEPGDTVSILPLGGDALGVSNEGFEWPLHNATLPLGTTRGISNVLHQADASISVRKGLLLCVITRQSTGKV